MKTPIHPSRRQQGVALLEVLVSVVILAIGLLGAVGLQARSYAALSDAGLRAEATMAADKLLGTMSNDQANLGNYALADGGQPKDELKPWLTETTTAIPNAKVTVAVTPELRRTRVDLRIAWTRKAGGVENEHRITSYVTN
ncbi:prepilin-type N-terminal cleavage/methylation domain-containing protein [Massilia sp. erpn]|uniref:type IV pilus modification PilV family protein n=1 Tax=Massilia sp. erpn TaxID=2738142 RepID=UPI0021051AE9|nr:prepilin-type N-terminal cleavage/methylation domain-containing protein [Massilia sp. erpn]UTY59172.1 prepilin-type N-terminal cleavage/methylation domain-containing protein [Massilia sp. erpn]